jgi:hypothetical protein
MWPGETSEMGWQCPVGQWIDTEHDQMQTECCEPLEVACVKGHCTLASQRSF